MLSPIGTTHFAEVLRELKKDGKEGHKIQRQQAHNFFDKRVNALQIRADKIREQAKHLSSMGWFHFAMGLVNAAFSIVGSFFSKISDVVAPAFKNLMKGVQDLVQNRFESRQKKFDLEETNLQVESEIHSDQYEKLKGEAADSQKRSRVTLQTLRHVNRDYHAGNAAMTKG